MKNLPHRLRRSGQLLLSTLLLAACTMMESDMNGCPTGLYVTFKYDYNIQRSDMFRDHVGSVTVYVFDEQERYVTQQTVENLADGSFAPLKKYGYQMKLNVPDGKYRLVALAQQRALEEIKSGPGAKYQFPAMHVGDSIESLQVVLDRVASRSELTDRTDESKPARVPNQNQPLDTLWHGIADTLFESSSVRSTLTTLNMIRNTNMLTLTIRQLDDPIHISADDYELFIVDNNGTTGYDNSLIDDEDLFYTPFRTWTSEFKNDKNEVVQRAAHAGITFNKLVYHDDYQKNALLVLRRKSDSREVAVINLPDCLAQGRNAVDNYRYSPQEFLDREYNYNLDFFLKGDSWQYLELSISVLSWSKRIENIDL